jgi:hypothetical protein
MSHQISAQFDSVMAGCEGFMNENYISDGQQYFSLITGDQIAEFSVVFYGGNTYRVITCGGNEDNLVFVLYDKDRNEIFNSSEFNNTPYWDFQFESTIECFIEAKFSPNTNQSGFAVLMIGLKK